MLYRLKTWIIAGLCLPGMAHAIAVDGVFAPTEGYSNVFSVTYQLSDLSYLYGGKLALGQDASGKQYMYFASPKAFVDNSFGINAIGWDAVGGHTFKDLLNSDKAVFTFQTQLALQGGLTQVTFDYLAANQSGAYGTCGERSTTSPTAFPNQCDGLSDTLGDLIVEDVATSLEYNIDIYGLRYTERTQGNKTVLEGYSPDADADYSNVEPGYEGWVFDLAYEIQFAPGTFDSDVWLYGDANAVSALITIDEPHASPSKFPGSSFPRVACIEGATGCGPSTVPAPGGLLLTLAGLAGLALRRRVGRRAAL